ncbi:cilia- and flagella-associated protein 221-like isoform X1 [Bombus affinis]|uniref:cilia- and flagella-associated protein 221-like isoform X1 n=1 Tax=Bombus affinis TaxID=309941 RepID=UPI0021B820D9|nr:cilia- and flagella-associated protein 221-like isoform X1 [Bombus affinis]
MDMDIFDQTQYCIDKTKKKNIHKFGEESNNGILSVVPSKLKFNFDFGNFKVQEKTVEITNFFVKPCPIRFLPMETHYFRFKDIYQRTWLNPGSVFKMNILFIPDENRDYNDTLKILYYNDQTTQIKIYAEMATKFSFPTIVNFGHVPLGRTVCYNIPIHSHAEKDFSFTIIPFNGGSCVDVYPRWGHIKSKQNPTIIAIIYRPLRYISMNFEIRIFISDLCKSPHIINFYAYTRPGLLREKLGTIEAKIKSKIQQKNISTTFCKGAKPISVKKNKPKYLKESTMKFTSSEKLLLKQCYFPLYTLHAVNCILNLKIRKLFNEYELKG